MSYDIRWKQRFQNYQKALGQFRKFLEKPELNELEKQGFIQSFEYTFELAWKTLKDFFEFQGETEIRGSRDAFRLGIQRGILPNGKIWMQMVESRILTSHTYNEELLEDLEDKFVRVYFPEFLRLERFFLDELKREDSQ